MKIIRRILIGIVTLLAVLIVALQVGINSKYVHDFAFRKANEFLTEDTRLGYDRLHFSIFRRFPKITAELDGLTITYPHDRWAAFDSTGIYDRLLSKGRGETVDTLARVSHFSVTVNPFKVLKGNVALRHMHLQGLALYAHSYDSLSANWNVIRTSSANQAEQQSVEEKDAVSGLPEISIGHIQVDGTPRAVYTAQMDTTFAAIMFDRMLLKGDVKLDELKIRGAQVEVDSMKVIGRLPADTLAFALDRFRLSEPRKQVFDINAEARALLLTSSLGRVHLPVGLDTRLGVNKTDESLDLDVAHLDLSVGHIPFNGSGVARLYNDSTYVKAEAKLSDCAVGDLLAQYGPAILPDLKGISTNAVLGVEVSADGYLSDNQVPAVEACVSLPDFDLTYKPLKLKGHFNVDIDATMTPSKYVKAIIHDFDASIPGLKMDLNGSAYDLLGRDPRFKACLVADASLDDLMYLLDGSGITAGGHLNADIDADAHLSELITYRFEKADISGVVTGDRLKVDMPADSIHLDLDNPRVNIKSNIKGLLLDADTDSLLFNQGSSLIARVRHMKNSFTISKVLERGGYAPRMELNNLDSALFVRSDVNRVGVRGAKLTLAAQKRIRPDDKRRKHFLDSLQRVYPGTPKDSLFIKMMQSRRKQGPLPSFMSEKDFEKGDVDIRLDESLSRYLKEWKPSGSLAFDRGFLVTPYFPLKTRLGRMSGRFDNKSLEIEELGVVSGASDVSLSARITGLINALVRKSDIDVVMDVKSNKLDINELYGAALLGLTTDKTEGKSEDDESFVVDSVNAADLDTTLQALFIVPANLTADIKLSADNVDYAGIKLHPVNSRIKMKERCLQLTETSVESNLGNIRLDAYYATRTKSDITAGINLDLVDMSADGIIEVLPMVDSLMPLIKSFKGKLSCMVSATTQIDTNMNVIMPTLDGVVRLSGKDLTIDDAGDFKKVTRMLFFKNPNIGAISDFSVDAMIHDSRIDLFPFIMSVDRYKVALRGRQNFDKSFVYHASILKSPLLFKFGVNIYGNPDDWKFSLGKAKYKNADLPVFTEQIDTIQVNMVKGIRNIFKRGANEVAQWNAKSKAALDKRARELNYSKDEDLSQMSAQEMSEMDQVRYELDQAALKDDEMAEIDAILEESLSNMDKLRKEFEEDVLDLKPRKKKKR